MLDAFLEIVTAVPCPSNEINQKYDPQGQMYCIIEPICTIFKSLSITEMRQCQKRRSLGMEPACFFQELA